MLYRIFVILQLFFLSLSECTRKLSELSIYASVEETYEWNIRDTFFSGDAMSYKLADKPSKYFDKIDPLSEIEGSIMHGAVVSNVISIKPFISQLTGLWLNSFVFIEQDSTSVDIFYAFGLSTENNKVPDFSKFINVAKSNPDYRCFDVDFITQTKFITDCQENDKNYFLIADTDGGTSTVENTQTISSANIRKIIVHTFYYTNAQQQYLLRGQHSDANGSLIEVFIINNYNVAAQPVLTLNSTSLSTLLSQEGVVLTFLDLQVEPNGDIFILDSLNGIFILKLLQTNNWALKEWNRISSQVYAFDFNYLINSTSIISQLALVFEDRIQYFQDKIPKATFQIPQEILNKNIQVEVSQQYIVLFVESNIYLYNQMQLIYKFTSGIFDKLIINPYEPDLVGVNEIASHRFLISDGILRFVKQDSSSDSQYITQLQATPQTGDFCKVDLKVQVLKRDDTQLYETQISSFPSSLTIPADPFNVDLLAIGPDITYSPYDVEKSGIEIDIKEIWKLNVTIQDKNVAFTDIYVIDESSFYFLQQLDSKETYLYLCEHQKFQQEIGNCTVLKTFSFDKILTQSTFHWWFEMKKIFFVVQEGDAILNFYLLDGQTFAQFDQLQQQEKILSFNVLINMIFVVLNNKILVYGQALPFQLAYNITTIQQPEQVFGNRLVDLIFIKTANEIIIGSMSILTSGSEFTVLKSISIIQGAEVKVNIGKKYFYVLQKTSEISQIDEYDFIHLQKIFQTKTLPLYNYKIQGNIESDSCEESGWLFVRCQDDKETVILVYEPGVLSHQSLKKIIKLQSGQRLQSIQDITIEADGGLQMFLHYNQQILSILQDSLVFVNSNTKSDSYVNNLLVGVEAKNDYNSKIILSQIPILDTHSIPLFDTSKNIVQKIQKKGDVAVVNIDSSYYTGQITTMSIDCKLCSEAVLQPQITNLTTGQEIRYDLIDGLIFNANYVVYLASSQLIFSYRNGTFSKAISLKDQLTILEQADNLFISEDKTQLIVSIIGSSASILLMECTAELECKVIKKINVAQAIRIVGLKLFSKTQLFILNSNPDDFTKFESSILTYTINADYSLALSQIINAQALGLQQLDIAGFEIVKHHTFYTVLFTDSEVGVRVVNFNQNNLNYISGSELFSLNNYQNDHFFVYPSTLFYQIKVTAIQAQDKELQLTTLIQTNNAAQYIFNLPFEIDTAPKLLQQKVTLQLILTPFATWQSVNKIAYEQNHLIVPYRKGTQAILLIYDLSGNYTASQTLTSRFALQEDYHGVLTSKFVLILEILDNQINFFTNIKFDTQTVSYFLLKYSYFSKSTIQLKNLQSWEDQAITLTVSNQYGTAKGQIQVTFYSSDDDDDDDSSDYTLVWILVGILGGIIILLVIFCLFLYFKNKRNKQSLLLVE